MKYVATTWLGVSLVTATAVAQEPPVTLQWFETSWTTMEDRTADAFMAGYGRVWTPPPSMPEGGGFNVGYACFDRFDLGSPGNQTRYGTEAGLLAVTAEQDKADIETFVDLILNHNAFMTAETPGFVTEGGYPGFVFSWGGDPNGDFHAEWLDCNSDRLQCRIAGLIDVAQESNHVMIRHPVYAGDPNNIPAGTLYNKPDLDNRRLYPDLSLPANAVGIHPFNLADPMAGDAVTENATGLLARYTRWLLEVVGVDGFRIDAAKHIPDWFFRDFYDIHVWERGKPDLNGNPTTPYCFLEVYDGDTSILDDYVCKGSTGNCPGVGGNRDIADFGLFWAMNSELNGTGLGSWYNIVNASFDGMSDGNANNGTIGAQFVRSHDDYGATMDNLAHAYILLRKGTPIVYFRAEEFGIPGDDFPRGGRGDALGGQYGSLITTLLDVRHDYARGDYTERWIDNDILIFERNNACLVGLNDRNDIGYDQRTVTTYFPENTRLHELTGNATDATVDPGDDIWDVVTVGAGGQVTIRVPRNKNVNGVTHDRSYVVYGPVNPDGDLTLSNVASIIPADPPGEHNSTRRLTEIEVIQADSFEVKLETDDADPLDDGEDDAAMLKLDAGLDVNGNGSVDSTDPSWIGYGYEDFLTESSPLASGGVDIGGGVFRGRYRQEIDTTSLSEGRHYLSVIAFRERPGGSPTIVETWRKVIFLDRVPPEVELAAPLSGETITSSLYQFIAESPDQTANKIHMFIDQPEGTDVVALAEVGQGLATRLDRTRFGLTISGMEPGHHRLDVVAYEETRPDPSVTTFTGIPVVINGNDGLGDINGDDRTDNLDIWPMVQMTDSAVQFDPAADLNGDGRVNSDDLPGFATKLYGNGAPQESATILERGDADPLTETSYPFFWVQENGASSDFGSVTNPNIEVPVGLTAPLYVWLNDSTLAQGYDGISLDAKLVTSNGGKVDVTIDIDTSPGRWYGATGGTVRTDSGGDGIDDCNAFDLTNTDTVTAPARLGQLNITGVSPGTVSLFLCIGGLGIVDSGNSALVQIGFGNGTITPESQTLSGGWFGFCTSVAEASITVTGSGGPAPGDYDLDGDVDMDDFAHLQVCLHGSNEPQTDPICADASLNGDNYVDQIDVELFRGCLSGTNVTADPNCTIE